MPSSGDGERKEGSESSWLDSKQRILIAPVSKAMYKYCPVESNRSLEGVSLKADEFKLHTLSLCESQDEHVEIRSITMRMFEIWRCSCPGGGGQ